MIEILFLFYNNKKNRPVSQNSQYHHPLSLNCSIPFQIPYQPVPAPSLASRPGIPFNLPFPFLPSHPYIFYLSFPPSLTTFPIFPSSYTFTSPNFPSLPYLPYLPLLALFSLYLSYLLYLPYLPFLPIPSLPYLPFPTLPSRPYLPYLTFHTLPSIPSLPCLIFPISFLTHLPYLLFPSLSFLYVTCLFLFQP